MFLNVQMYFIILETDDEQFTLSMKKKSLHVTINWCWTLEGVGLYGQ